VGARSAVVETVTAGRLLLVIVRCVLVFVASFMLGLAATFGLVPPFDAAAAVGAGLVSAFLFVAFWALGWLE